LDRPTEPGPTSDHYGHDGDRLDQVENDVDIDHSRRDVLDEVEQHGEGADRDLLDEVEESIEESEPTPGWGAEPPSSDSDDRRRDPGPEGKARGAGGYRGAGAPRTDGRGHWRTADYSWPDWIRIWARTHRPGGPPKTPPERDRDEEAVRVYCRKRDEIISLSVCANCDDYEPEEGEELGAPCRYLAPAEDAEQPDASEVTPEETEEPSDEDEDEDEPASLRVESLSLTYCNLHERDLSAGDCRGCPDYHEAGDTGTCWHSDVKPGSDEVDGADEQNSD